MESTLRALRVGAMLSALALLQSGCCTIDLTCVSGACGHSYGPSVQRAPLFDGTLKHRVKGSIHSCANKIACAGGCGEVYWDETVNDPAVCDRCDYTGTGTAGCGTCSPWFVRLAKLWGTPYQASCGTASCSGGSCLGHGSLVNHLRGHRGCASCGAGHEVAQADCPSCQHGTVHETYDAHSHGDVIHEGDVIHHGSAPSSLVPTPAKPRAIEGGESAAPSSAQQRMRLHQRPSHSDPNGRLSAQLVNGHKRLVSNP